MMKKITFSILPLSLNALNKLLGTISTKKSKGPDCCCDANPFEKIANKKLAEVVKTKAYEQIDKTKLEAYKKAEIPANEAEEKAKSIENESDEQSKKILDMAKQRADKLKQ